MSGYLESLQTSVLLFPLVGLLVFVPLRIAHQRRFGELHEYRAFVSYLGVFAVVTAMLLTILPLPKDTQPVCIWTERLARNQFIPLNSFVDIFRYESRRHLGWSLAGLVANKSLLQIVLNTLLLFPVGFIFRALYRESLLTTSLVAFLFSLFLEVTQLTGIWGLANCPYRIFDVDDLLTNTAGAAMGWYALSLAPWLPNPSASEDDLWYRRRRGERRRKETSAAAASRRWRPASAFQALAAPFKGVLGQGVFRLVVTVALLFLNPFNLSEVTEKISALTFNKILSPFYSTAQRDKIVVVTIDERGPNGELLLPLDENCADAGRCSRVWPITFSEHAALLRSIVGPDPKGAPKAIFVDILFNNAHNKDDTFAELYPFAVRGGACRGCPPVLFATESPAYGAPSLFETGLGDLPASPDAVADITWRGDDYPMFVQPDGAGTRPRVTAAVALYRMVAEDRNFGAAGDSPMAVQWGYQPRRGATYFPANGFGPLRCPRADNLAARARVIVDVVIAGVLSSRDAAAKKRWSQMQPCAFHAHIDAADLLPANAESEFRFRDTLRGAIVLIGSNIPGIPDVVESPVHGALPGVFYHAMALDNLMTFKADYYRVASEVSVPFLGSIAWTSLVEAALVALGIGLAVAVSMSARKRTKWWFVLVLFTASVAAVLVATFAFRTPSLNWIGSFFAGALNIVQASRRVTR